MIPTEDIRSPLHPESTSAPAVIELRILRDIAAFRNLFLTVASIMMTKLEDLSAKLDEQGVRLDTLFTALTQETAEIKDALSKLPSLDDAAIQAAIDRIAASNARIEQAALAISDLIPNPPPPPAGLGGASQPQGGAV